MSKLCRPCLKQGVITELSAAWQQSGRFECEDCAETVARKHKWTVVAFHKQGYMAFSREAAPSIVKQLNPKRGGL
jgi:superfamily II helicase